MKTMIQGNGTRVTEFILLGFAVRQEEQYILFFVFLVIYIISLVANFGMILLIRCDAHLHTPMYFFLQNLAFVDLCYTSTITPKMLVNFLVSDKSIPFSGCVIQLYFYGTFATIECYLLAAMAADRYVAFCNPLRYPTVMSQRVWSMAADRYVAFCNPLRYPTVMSQRVWSMAADRYVAFCNPLRYPTVMSQLVIGSYVVSSLNATTHTGFLFSLSFCNSNTINHFFCDVPPILALSCSNIDVNVKLIIILVGFNLLGTLLVVFFSYVYILAAILKMPSAAGRHKAFSACASHMTAVTLFYGTLSYMYLQPSSSKSQENDKVASVFYGIVIPMLNPLIYSLRNKEVKEAMKVLLKSCS